MHADRSLLSPFLCMCANSPSLPRQANTLAPYLTAIRHSLDSALCLRNFPSQVVERHNKPEVELRYVCGLFPNCISLFVY